jgi:hypothetical protein
MPGNEDWFSLHMPEGKARSMTREQWYATRSWLRRVRHIINLRNSGVRLEGNIIIFPATDAVLPEKFK